MPIDPRIALGVEPIKVESPISMMTNVMQLRNAQKQYQLQQQAEQKAQIEEGIKTISGYSNKADALTGLYEAFESDKIDKQHFDQMLGVLKKNPDWATAQQELITPLLSAKDRIELQTQQKQQQQFKDIMSGGLPPTSAAVTPAPTNALAPVDQEQALFNQLNPSQQPAVQPANTNALAPTPAPSVNALDPNAVNKQITALYALGTPQAMAQAKYLESQLAAQAKDITPKLTQVDIGGAIKTIDMNPNSPTFKKELLSFTKTQTPAQAQTAAEKAVDDTGITKAERNKREAAFPKANAAFDSSNTEIDSLGADLTALANHPGLSSITGARAGTELAKGATTLVSQDAADAQALLDKIKSKGTLRALVDLRNSSPTGGALGNVSDADVRLLTNSFGNLNTKQSTPTFKNSLDDILSQLSSTKTRLKNAYDETYSYRSQNAPAASTTQTAPIKINTPQERDKLAPGTVYIGPDGVKRTKS